jgi:hypothetical protein
VLQSEQTLARIQNLLTGIPSLKTYSRSARGRSPGFSFGPIAGSLSRPLSLHAKHAITIFSNIGRADASRSDGVAEPMIDWFENPYPRRSF